MNRPVVTLPPSTSQQAVRDAMSRVSVLYRNLLEVADIPAFTTSRKRNNPANDIRSLMLIAELHAQWWLHAADSGYDQTDALPPYRLVNDQALPSFYSQYDHRALPAGFERGMAHVVAWLPSLGGGAPTDVAYASRAWTSKNASVTCAIPWYSSSAVGLYINSCYVNGRRRTSPLTWMHVRNHL